MNCDDLVVVDQLYPARVPEEGRNRRGDEVLVVADADDQRALLAGAHDRVRLVRGDRGEGVVATQLEVGEPRRLGQVARAEQVEVLLDQVRDDFRVGLRREDVALGLERVTKLDVVLDDAVEDDVHAPRAVGVRVRVALGRLAVGGPARVADARGRDLDAGRERGAAAVRLGVHGLAQPAEVPDRADRLDLAVGQQGHPGGVIAPVLQTLQPVHQQLAARAFAHITHDSAHSDQRSLWSDHGKSSFINQKEPLPAAP